MRRKTVIPLISFPKRGYSAGSCFEATPDKIYQLFPKRNPKIADVILETTQLETRFAP